MSSKWRRPLTAVMAASLVSGVLGTLPLSVAHAAVTPPVAKNPLVAPNGGLPSAAGAKAEYLPGSQSVTPSGGFTYQLPLDVPAGRAGMSPQLSLSYSSSGPNGPLGLGWSMPAGSLITRCPQTLQHDGTHTGVHYDANDRFCLDGQVLVGVGGTYGGGDGEYRTQNDSFAKILSTNGTPPPNTDGTPGTPSTPATGPDTFTVFSKDGRIRTYQARTAVRLDESVKLTDEGRTKDANGIVTSFTSAHHAVPVTGAASTPRVAWELVSDEDRSGNGIHYDYTDWLTAHGKERLLTKISYTYGTSTAAYREVDFTYEYRPDPMSTWVSGVQYGQTQRLKTIEMHAPDPGATKLVWSYNLSYLATGGNTGRTKSMLSQVQKCGAQGGCLPAKQFTWAASTMPTFTTTSRGSLPTEPMEAQNGIDESPFAPQAQVADVNGDGIDDLLFTPGGNALTTPDQVRLGTRNPNNGGVVYPLSAPVTVGGKGDWPSTTSSSIPSSQFSSLTGDGKSQLVMKYLPGFAAAYGPQRTLTKILRWDAATSTFKDTGIKVNDTVPGVLGAGQTGPGSRWESYGDVNGDGLPDRLFTVPSVNAQGADWTSPQMAVQMNLGNGKFDNPSLIDSNDASSVSGNPAGGQLLAADIQGDGRAAVLQEQSTAPVSQLHDPVLDPDNLNSYGTGDGTNEILVGDDATASKLRGGPAHGSFAFGGGRTIAPLDGQQFGFNDHVGDSWDGYRWNPQYVWHPNALGDSRFFSGDFNGDGLKSTLMIRSSVTSTTVNTPGDGGAILWNTGTGLHYDPNAPALNIPHDDLMDIRIGDVNGDGKDDIVSFYNTGLWVDRHDLTKNDDDTLMHSGGGVDKITIMLSNGDGTFQREDLATSAGTPRIDNGRAFSQLGNFSGTGLLDIVKNDTTAAGGSLQVMSQTATEPDRITNVTDENAAAPAVTVNYTNQWTDHPELLGTNACTAPLVCMTKGMPVVRSVTTRDNNYMAARQVYYSYEDPVVDTRQGFLGFSTFRVWDPTAQAETVSTFDVRTSAGGNAKGTFHPFADVPQTVTTTVLTTRANPRTDTTATARVSTTKNTYAFTPLNGINASYAVFPSTSTTTTSEGPASINWNTSLAGSSATVHLTTSASTQSVFRTQDDTKTFDLYGNLTHEDSKTEGGTEQVTDITPDLSAARISAWLISTIDHKTVTSTTAGANPTSSVLHSNYHADNIGRPYQVITEQGTPDQVTTTTALGGDGVPTSTTTSQAGLPDRITHTEYTPLLLGQPDERIYPSQTWTEHSVAAYDPSSWQAIQPAYGVPMATEDINGNLSTTTIDDLGRPLLQTAPQKPNVHLSYAPHTDANGDVDGQITSSVTDTGQNGNSSTNTTTTVTDALGHTLSTTRTGFDGTPVTTISTYDILGRPALQSRPFTAGATPVYSKSFYDNLGRPTSTVSPDSKTQTWTYPDPFTTVLTDPLGHQSKTITDVSGRTVESDTAYTKPGNVTAWAATKTGYGPFDLPTTVTDDHGNVTTTAYTVYGKPKSSTDPDRGATTTTYYPTGEPNTITHTGTGNTSTYHYDDLGRQTTVVDHDSAANTDSTTTYTWDTAANGIGQLATAHSPDNITTTSHYDTSGRNTGTDYTDGATNTTYSTSGTYDAQGRPSTITYPNAPGRSPMALTTTYNNYGYATDLADTTTTPAQTLSHKVTANADGSITGMSLTPNGTTNLAYAYDPTTGRLTNSSATAVIPNTKLQNLDYTYYDNGLVHTRNQNDTTANRKETFSYDTFNQLTGWDLSNANQPTTTTSYNYDTIGNLTSATNTTGITPGEVRTFPASGNNQPHAMTGDTNPDNAGAETYHHDAQGRQDTVTGPNNTTLRQTTYTALDLPKTVTDANGKTTIYAYDAFGTRVKETGPSGTKFTVPGMFEARVDAADKHTWVYYLPGVGQAVYNGTTTTVEYTLNDPLGSTTAVTDSTGAVKQSYFYDPFGAHTNADGTRTTNNSTPGDVTHLFTGQEHNDAQRLINMNGRVYDPLTKEFLTPDPVTSNHPYTYVNSSPLNNSDPTGYDTQCQLIGTCTAQDYVNNLGSSADPSSQAAANNSYGAWGSTDSLAMGMFSNSLSTGFNNFNSVYQPYQDFMNTCIAGCGTSADVESDLQANLTADAKAAIDNETSFQITVGDALAAVNTAMMIYDGAGLITGTSTALNEGFGAAEAIGTGGVGIGDILAATRTASAEATVANDGAVGGEMLFEGLPGKGLINSGPTSPGNVNSVNVFGGVRNCECTADAGTAILSGSPASALNRLPSPALMSQMSISAGSSTSQAGAILAEYGEGAVAKVGAFGPGGNHIFNARIEDGAAVFYDFQKVEGGRIPPRALARYDELFNRFSLEVTSSNP